MKKIQLPMADRKPKMQNSVVDLSRITILVVENSSTQAQALKQILEQEHCRVTLAADGEAALRSLAESRPDVVITDVVMPVMDGYELCRQIRSTKSTSTLPVILVTSLSDPEDVIRGLAAGADSFIREPFGARYLTTRLRDVVSNVELRRTADVAAGVRVHFADRDYVVRTEPSRAIDLLLSIYAVAVEQNRELVAAGDALRESNCTLEEVNQDLEAFSYSISHDLKAPLRSILGFVEIIKQDYAPLLDDEGRRVLGVVAESAENMRRMIDDLLRFARMSHKELGFQMLDMNNLFRESWEQVGSAGNGRNIEFNAGQLPNVVADRSALQEVIVNLLSNAVKFTRRTPVAHIDVTGRIEQNLAVYTVRDNGVGFEPAGAKKLFGAFQRLHNSEDFEGSGIGLALARRIVQRHGGSVAATGVVGQGAEFSFSLPSARTVEG
jgi:two-component system, sensor histidine kinase and response regulator